MFFDKANGKFFGAGKDGKLFGVAAKGVGGDGEGISPRTMQ